MPRGVALRMPIKMGFKREGYTYLCLAKQHTEDMQPYQYKISQFKRFKTRVIFNTNSMRRQENIKTLVTNE